MNKLLAELQRLYFLAQQQWHGEAADEAPTTKKTVALKLVSTEGTSRTLVVHFLKPADWEQVAHLYRAVQDELELPAPALSVSGRKGFRLWFSLAEAVPVAQAESFLAALRHRYLADLSVADLEFLPQTVKPASAAPAVLKLPPSPDAVSGKWSAFIDPSMGSMFIEEPGLEMAPNMDRQAGILAALQSITPDDFRRALAMLQAPVSMDAAVSLKRQAASPSAEATEQSEIIVSKKGEQLHVKGHFSDPKSFLLAVMNDQKTSARLRIRAARALLPYFAAKE